MSSDLPPSQPVDANLLPEAPVSAPGRLTTAVVMVIVLSVLGLFSGLSGLGGMFVNIKMQENFAEQGQELEEGNPFQAQMAMQAAIAKESNKYNVYNAIILTFQIVVCTVMVVASIRVLKRKPGAAKMLTIACALIIPSDIAKAIPGYLTMQTASEVLDENMGAFMPPGEDSEEAAEIAAGIVKVTMLAMSVFLAVWLLIKIALYLFAITCLRRPEVKRYLSEPQTT